jgi:hypothetical protein
VVHHADETDLRGRLPHLLGCVALILSCVALVSGCGGTAHSSTLGLHSSLDVGESARSDTCEQWQKGTVAERHGTLIRLRKFAESPVGSSQGLQNGHALTDEQGYKLFQSFCSKHFARGFKLYKLYERAAAFVGH